MKNRVNSKEYIFLDESGKPEIFSRRGVNLVLAGTTSKHLVISAVRIKDQLLIQQAVTECRLLILKNKTLSKKFSPAYSLNAFHAQTDYPEVKKIFYEWIKNTKIDLKISVIIAEKLKAYPSLQKDAGRLYATIAGHLLKPLLHSATNIEVIFSRRDASLKARERLNTVVDTLRIAYAKEHQINQKTTIIYHHNPHYTHGGLQIADYIAYAIFQVVEKNNRIWYEIIKNKIGYIQDIFNKKSYFKSSPL